MKGDFFFMKVLAVCGSDEAADLLRQAAGVAAITVDLSNVTVAGASHALAKEDFDVVFVDGAIAEAEQNKVIDDARSCRSQPFARCRSECERLCGRQQSSGWKFKKTARLDGC
jgi:hypothetical protein